MKVYTTNSDYKMANVSYNYYNSNISENYWALNDNTKKIIYFYILEYLIIIIIWILYNEYIILIYLL